MDVRKSLNILIKLVVFSIIAVICSNSTAHASSSSHQIIISKAENELAYIKNGQFEAKFPVGTGRTPSLTPEGRFQVVSKIKEPYYRRGRIPGGSPNNPLGARWLGLSVPGTGGAIYGIHGNNNPSSIGKYVSAGCIRMHNEDVIWLFNQVPMGTEVLIVSNNWSHFPLVANNNINYIDTPIYVNNEQLNINYNDHPFVEAGTTMVSLRSLFENIDAHFNWDNQLQQVSVKIDSLEFSICTIEDKILADRIDTELKMPHSRFVDDRVYVPLRAICELIGGSVNWSEDTIEVTF
ncbi:pterin-4a-carbinolamine dehydratase [Desulfitispora alkaliphila]|uniref:L,D-transpeptidase family protein n=1 Tax=Desulfitispora alkaliphila TaxID=622674 RepID=UPI003D1C6720